MNQAMIVAARKLELGLELACGDVDGVLTSVSR